MRSNILNNWYKTLCSSCNLSTQNDAKLLGQLKFSFKKAINWNKYQSKISAERPNKYLYYLIGPSFQGVNSLFVLSFENNGHQTSYKKYFLTSVKIKDYNIMVDGKNFFD